MPIDPERRKRCRIAEISDIRTIDLIGAQRHRLSFERKGLLRLQPCGLHTPRGIEGVHADRVETPAMTTCPLSRQR